MDGVSPGQGRVSAVLMVREAPAAGMCPSPHGGSVGRSSEHLEDVSSVASGLFVPWSGDCTCVAGFDLHWDFSPGWQECRRATRHLGFDLQLLPGMVGDTEAFSKCPVPEIYILLPTWLKLTCLEVIKGVTLAQQCLRAEWELRSGLVRFPVL